ncbi:putative fad dependent oxidoreductase [Diaporthe ampelina]|uniref:Putative fad dependent oxidoreductase n=1 Tax=Diaporthe ampelina TaxID=1214573 RepID=A0A0G2HNC6_9PEZI|nr:putative fad dependent oxidoreductase [Diaporthe ampelina]
MVSHNVPSLVMWRDLTPYPGRLIQSSATSPHVLIVGAGVTGLVTAWVLLDKGYKVTIVSKDWANFTPSNRLTAQIAGALWEYPPAVCGAHTDRISLSNSKRWCMTAYHAWDAIASLPELSRASGVRMMPSDFFFPEPVEKDPAQFSKMAEIISSGVKGFRQDSKLMEQRNVNPSYGAVDAYELLAPIIDTDQAMMWLMSLVHGKGATTVTETITGDLFHQEEILRARFGADAIINATGLAGTEIAGDPTCYPIRGALIRVINDGKDFAKVEAALTITADAVRDSNEIVFLVPRNDNILLIGGIAQPHESTLDLTLDSPIVKRMRQRCEAFLPGLKSARLDATYPLAQGLRPFRAKNVRVERELRSVPGTDRPSRIVHSYGQGGAGWSLSFGCAGDVANLVEEAMCDLVPTPMEFDHTYSDGNESHGTTSSFISVSMKSHEEP